MAESQCVTFESAFLAQKVSKWALSAGLSGRESSDKPKLHEQIGEPVTIRVLSEKSDLL